MAKREAEKTTALVYVAVIFILAVVHAVTEWPELTQVAVCEDCSLFARMAYPLFHSSLLHAILNAWCLLSIVFIYDVSWLYLITAYLIAVSCPALVSCSPTVGASGICFALLGMISFQTLRRFFFHGWMAMIIASGFVMPYLASRLFGLNVAQPNNWLHIWCYLIGLIAGYLIHSHNSHSSHHSH